MQLKHKSLIPLACSLGLRSKRRRGYAPCSVHGVLCGIVLVGQSFFWGSQPDRRTELTSYRDRDSGPSQVSLFPTQQAGNHLLAGSALGLAFVAPFLRVSPVAADPTGTIRLPFSASDSDGGLNPPWKDLGETRRSASVSLIPIRRRVRKIAMTAGRLTDPSPVSFTANTQTGSSYFITPKATSGEGTLNNPFGLSDLLDTTTTPVSQGPALKALQPGDTLFFRGGNYSVSGSTNGNYWWNQLISPTVSGTASQPFTLSAYPGETPNFVMSAGAQPLFGTAVPQLNYIRFLGFTIQPCSVWGGGVTDHYADAVNLQGTGNEVAYCKIIGQTHSNVTDNYQAIWLMKADYSWIHHNEIYGFIGSYP